MGTQRDEGGGAATNRSLGRVFQPRPGFDPAHTRREFTPAGADVPGFLVESLRPRR